MAAGKTPQTAESTDELTDGSRGSNLLLSALLAIFIVLTAGTFERFPGMTFVSEGWIALVLGYALIVYPYTKITGGWRLSSLEVYVFGLLGVIPILAGISARMEFGQPLIFGLLAQRDMALVFGSVILLQAFRRYPRLLDATETALMIVVWGTLSIYIGVMILFDPADLASREIGIVTGGAVSRAVFKFDHLFIVFGFLYYGFRGFRRRSWSDYGLALVLLAWLIVGAGGRSMLLAAIGSYVLLVILRSNWSRRLTWLASATVVSLSLISILYALAPGSIAGLGQKFSAAALVLATGESGEDFSSNSRILQFLLVLPYLLSNWLLGSGVLSNQWHGGYDGVLGAYFFPSDIGIFGALFSYGVVGIAFFAMQFVFAGRAAAAATSLRFLHLHDACTAFLLYFAVHSLATGYFAFYVEIGLLFVAILCCLPKFRILVCEAGPGTVRVNE